MTILALAIAVIRAVRSNDVNFCGLVISTTGLRSTCRYPDSFCSNQDSKLEWVNRLYSERILADKVRIDFTGATLVSRG